MSLGKPDLYLKNTLQDSTAAGTRPTLAGCSIGWGNDSRLEFDPPSTLSAAVLVRPGAPIPNLSPGAPVGLVDPVSGRSLFAGQLATQFVKPDERIKGAQLYTFTAVSPLSDLSNHTVFNMDWTHDEAAPARFNRLAATIARGWTLQGPSGLTWINAGRLKFQSKNWLELVDLFCRSNTYRRHDTSAYVPGAGLVKRMNITAERNKTAGNPPAVIPPTGTWHTGGNKPAAATGMACIPDGLIRRGVEWEKTPDDTITDVKLSTYGSAVVAEDDESTAFEYWMDAYVNNTAMQNAYGFRQTTIETDLSSFNATALEERIPQIVNYWLDADTQWRPTDLEIPDSRKVDTATMLNLLATDSRHMAALYVPAPAGVTLPAKIHSFVMGGKATWDGKKWITELTLGRTID